MKTKLMTLFAAILFCAAANAQTAPEDGQSGAVDRSTKGIEAWLKKIGMAE